MALREAFRDYLASGARASEAMTFAAAVADAELADLAGAIVRFADRGPDWFDRPDGRRAYVGPQPPVAEPGELWIDSCELAAMILLPAYVDDFDHATLARDRSYDCWFALEPVRKFQLGAFLEVAPLRRERRRRDWLDPARLLRGHELEPVIDISFDEAGAYLRWFGKTCAAAHDWQAAWQHFGIAPWSSVDREWGGPSAATSGFALVIDAETLESDDGDDSREHGEHERPGDTTFRSRLSLHGVIDDSLKSDLVGGRARRGG